MNEAIRKAQGKRLRRARYAAGYRSAREAALTNKWPESTYRAHEDGRRTIGQDDAERYASKFRALGVNITGQAILYTREVATVGAPSFHALPSRGDDTPMVGDQPLEGEHIEDASRLPERVRDFIGSEMKHIKNAEAWIISTNLLDASGYLPGDYTIVDMDRQPRPRDIVLAMSSGAPTFRVYLPPFLVSSTRRETLTAPLLVDNMSVIVRGVVVASLRSL